MGDPLQTPPAGRASNLFRGVDPPIASRVVPSAWRQRVLPCAGQSLCAEQLVDLLLAFAQGRAAQEGLRFLEGGRATDEVQIKASLKVTSSQSGVDVIDNFAGALG